MFGLPASQEIALLVFGLPGGMEWVILAIIALLVFGGARLANAGKNAGQAIRGFKEEMSIGKGDAPQDATKADEGVVEAELVDPDDKPRPTA